MVAMESLESFLKPEFWEQQWAALTNVPVILTLPILIVGLIVWLFRGWMSQSERDGWKEQITGLEQRLKFAASALTKSDRDTENLKKEFKVYKAEVVAEGSKASPAKVDAAILRFSKGNAAVRSEVFGALQILDCDVAPFINIKGGKKR